MKPFVYALGRGVRNGLVALGALALLGTAIAVGASYSLTAGTGTNFASVVVSALNYAAGVVCDPTAGITHCATIDTNNQLEVSQATAANLNATVTGTVTANAGTNLNTSALATSANQTNASQKSQIVDGSGNVIASTTNALNVDVTNANANGQATMANSSPVVIASNQSAVTVAGGAKGGLAVVNGGSNYVEVAASQTAQVLQTSTGAAGDYLSHCVIYPATTGAGAVTVFDNTNSAANNVIQFVTGTLSNLAPIAVPVGAVSVNGAWKATTGANVAVVCFGKFS